MRIYLSVIVDMLIVIAHDAASSQDFHLDSPRNNGLLRFEINNDAIWDRDSNFSNGWSIQYHTVRYDNWERSRAPEIFKWVGHHFPTLDNGV